MNENIKLAVLGGDERQSLLATMLAERGYKVRTAAMSNDACGAIKCKSPVDAVSGCNAIILPLPASRGGIYLNENTDYNIYISEILDACDSDTIIFAGRADAILKGLCEMRSLTLRDYYADSELLIKNCVLTAEGALAIYMNDMKRSVYGSRILVTGSGRVAKCVYRIFNALGAGVTVLARDRAELTWAQLSGCVTADIESPVDMARHLASGYDCIINTVPVEVIGVRDINFIPEGTLIIDLASAPYGVDIEAARKRGLRLTRAVSLPGKYAPESAAAIIADSVVRELSGGGIQWNAD